MCVCQGGAGESPRGPLDKELIENVGGRGGLSMENVDFWRKLRILS